MLRFEWDAAKARTNERKHGVRFDDAMLVFEDIFAVFQPDRHDETGELRWHVIGMAGAVAVIVVVHTVWNEGHDEWIRIISARLATRKERRTYEQARTKDIG